VGTNVSEESAASIFRVITLYNIPDIPIKSSNLTCKERLKSLLILLRNVPSYVLFAEGMKNKLLPFGFNTFESVDYFSLVWLRMSVRSTSLL
jgi:hypothetical protein